MLVQYKTYWKKCQVSEVTIAAALHSKWIALVTGEVTTSLKLSLWPHYIWCGPRWNSVAITYFVQITEGCLGRFEKGSVVQTAVHFVRSVLVVRLGPRAFSINSPRAPTFKLFDLLTLEP